MTALREVEKKIADITDHEEVYVFSAEGNLLLHKIGGADRVEFDNEDLDKLVPGSVLTHNHPSDTRNETPGGELWPLSDVDTLSFLTNPLTEARAVDGDKVHILRKLQPVVLPGFIAELWYTVEESLFTEERALWGKPKTPELSQEFLRKTFDGKRVPVIYRFETLDGEEVG